MFFKMIKPFLLTFVLFFTASVFADDHNRSDKYEPVRSKLQLCFTCHGQAGESPDPTYPLLAGQHLYYIYLQLKDFKSGARENTIMGPIAQGLLKEEMLLIAEYFSEQEWPDIRHKNKSKKMSDVNSSLAKTVINAGQCVQCHLGGFEGNSGFPRLSGQYREYLKKTMLDFKSKKRKNDAAKSSLLATFSDEEINAVAEYLGDFKPE